MALEMLDNFVAFQVATEFYRHCERIRGARHLMDQLLRASSSISLNLAEGSGRETDRDRRRFYRMALGSVRESQAILHLLPDSEATALARKTADRLGALVFRLCRALDQQERKQPNPKIPF